MTNRWSKTLRLLTVGEKENPLAILRGAREPAITRDLIVVRAIPFLAPCAHDLIPFSGTVTIGYLPRAQIVGLGCIARLVAVLSRRRTLQERLGEELCETFSKVLRPRGIGVIIEAIHPCMRLKNPGDSASPVLTVHLRGQFQTHAAQRRIFLTMAGYAVSKR